MQIKFLTARNFVFSAFPIFQLPLSSLSPLVSAPLPLPRAFVRMLT
jgi:hypothetical protein